MSMENHQPPIDVLDQATVALRNVPVSDVPPPRCVAATIATLHSHSATPEVLQLQHRRQLMFRIARYSSLAAAVILLAVVTCVVMLWDRGATPAFAQVVENMKRATSVSFAFHLNLSNSKPPFSVKPLTEGKAYQQGDLMRAESRVDQNGPAEPYRPLDSVSIGDLRTKEVLVLDPISKTASKWDIDKVATIDPIEAISTLADKDAEFIGEEELNGRKTRVFQLLQINFVTGGKADKLKEGESGKLWVDAESGLPVKITAEMFSGVDHNKISAVFDDFVWNKPIDPKLFKMDIPEGFQASDKILGSPEPAK